MTTSEVGTAMSKTKNGKTTDPDDIPAKVWKMLSPHCAIHQIIEEGGEPKAWTTSITVLIWKGKCDVSECSNYRPIHLLCHMMKLFECVLDSHLRNIISVTLNQCVFV